MARTLRLSRSGVEGAGGLTGAAENGRLLGGVRFVCVAQTAGSAAGRAEVSEDDIEVVDIDMAVVVGDIAEVTDADACAED